MSSKSTVVSSSLETKTADYFNTHVHEYGQTRLSPFIEMINHYQGDAPSLIDIGCGYGNALEYLQANTRLHSLYALDVSEASVASTLKRLNCDAKVGSILDNALVDSMAGKFDFALLAALLHHLIAGTRTASRQLAKQALTNALKLVKSGGYILLMEPVFSSRWTMDIVFYVKRAIATFTSNRLCVLGYWNNIGAPIVSYYDCNQLKDIVDSIDGCALVASSVFPREISKLMRIAGITDRSDATFIIQKTGNAANRSATLSS